jgi:hypothetical protein
MQCIKLLITGIQVDIACAVLWKSTIVDFH